MTKKSFTSLLQKYGILYKKPEDWFASAQGPKHDKDSSGLYTLYADRAPSQIKLPESLSPSLFMESVHSLNGHNIEIQIDEGQVSINSGYIKGVTRRARIRK